MKTGAYIGICMLLIILFSYTAAAKLIDLPLFFIEMHNQPMPLWLTTILAYAIPSIEILIVIALLTERFRYAGLVISLFLMLLFTAYTALILLHVFPRVPCSCGGVIKNLTWLQHLVFNVFFDLIIIWALFIHGRGEHHKLIHA